jgi:hypothetical protein
MQSSFRLSPEPIYSVRPSFTPPLSLIPLLIFPWFGPDRATLSHLVLLFMNSIIYIILFMNNTSFQKYSKYFSSYIFSHFDIEREREIQSSRGLFISKHYTYHLFTIQRTFNKIKNTHISSLHKNIIFIFFNLYPFVSWGKNSNTDLNIGVSFVSRGICFISTTRVQISSDRESQYFSVKFFHDFIT